MRELKFEELTLEQKLGMVLNAYWTPWYDHGRAECEEWILDQIKKRALGSVWIQQSEPDADVFLKRVRETADYPILIFTDAETGIGEYKVGKQNAIGCTDSEAHAYAFGKALGVTARKRGYSVVCNPVIDLSKKGSQRSMGADVERVTRLAAAEIRGMHDGGILSVCKHYPGSSFLTETRDTHMESVENPETKQELLETHLYPYLKLNEQGLLDGLMTGHNKYPNIDPEHPASLSKTIIDIIREQGFEGFTITDALCMEGVTAKYGFEAPVGLCIGAGNTFALPYSSAVEIKYNQMKMGYEKGYFTDEQLDAAVKIVLETQKKALELQTESEITEEEEQLVKSINKDSVFAKTDDGVPTSISRDGKHFFILMIGNETKLDETVEVDTFSKGWYHPKKIIKRIGELFPNSVVKTVFEFPVASQHVRIFAELSAKKDEIDDVIFLSFSEFLAFAGGEALTYRTIYFLECLQRSNRVSTLVHFGNPCVLEPLPHFPRVIIGGNSSESVDACLEVLAGNYPAKGKLTYDVKLK